MVSPFVPQQKRQRPKTSQDRKYKLENKSTYLEQAKARESGKIIMLRHPIPSTKLPPYVAFICFRVNFALTLLLFSGASQSRARLFHNFHFDFLVVNLLLLYVCRLSYTKNQNLPSNAERKKKEKRELAPGCKETRKTSSVIGLWPPGFALSLSLFRALIICMPTAASRGIVKTF